ncbi:hypothetical protein B0T26DRAFT_747561 [Lasiosphaeria miniovina]|uniref:Uncharacterized protein n=1 Tax=Lasiosphaeria miniovina TaxID=1954250 RepID=A0AA40B3V8_9PEZI|nr:uncharacterized protein B0T26DRAFT_747561 [Lasiosphaeria miniovina]KAK0727210.1 hypothetical protein B0T26DRAFT_747561 [Lasiosphaeria miniovina]
MPALEELSDLSDLGDAPDENAPPPPPPPLPLSNPPASHKLFNTKYDSLDDLNEWTTSAYATVEDAVKGWESPNEPTLYHIRVSRASSGPETRYLVSPHPTDSTSPIPDFRGDHLAFDTVPAGAWDVGRAVLDSSLTAKLVLGSTSTLATAGLGLDDAGPAWHARRVDLVDLLDLYHNQQQQESPDSSAAHGTYIQCMKRLSAAPGHAHGITAESAAYAAIGGHDASLAPRFLGHVTDNGGARVIGFLLERVPPATREAFIGDLLGCRRALACLHALG